MSKVKENLERIREQCQESSEEFRRLAIATHEADKSLNVETLMRAHQIRRNTLQWVLDLDWSEE